MNDKEKKELCEILGLDAETIDGDYKEACQRARKMFEDGFKKLYEKLDKEDWFINEQQYKD